MKDAKLMHDIRAIIRSGNTSPFFKNYLGGRWVQEFEKEFARYVGARYAVSMANGTLALNAAYDVWKCQTGWIDPDAVVSPYTFVATVSELARTGYRPIFADVEPSSGLISADAVRQSHAYHSSFPSLLVVMYPLGSMPEDDTLETALFLGSHAIPGGVKPVIEDACQALSPTFKDRHMKGTFAAFSMQQTKSLSTGEGGMVTTDWEEGAMRLRHIRNHGNKYGGKIMYSHIISTNYRLTEIQARIGLEALKGYNAVVKRQLRLGQILHEAMDSTDWLLPQNPWSSNGYIFMGRICGPSDRTTREKFLLKTKRWNKGVPGYVVGPGYSELVSELPAFRKWANQCLPCPNAQELVEKSVWFDIRKMSTDTVKGLARTIERFRP